jgi:glycosyltransferase involved in cell wall biosynthesis
MMLGVYVNTLKPRLSIGMPVYNGERYLEKALNSILCQTFTDFELIISDNASTDRTSEICQAYAAKDARVRYHRNVTNIGAMQNWYLTFEMSSGEFFLGAAHDDIFHPMFVERCIETLNNHPEAVVCYTRTKVIDEEGNYVGNFVVDINTSSAISHVRFYNVIAVDYLCIQLLGVFRSSAFRSTRQFLGYKGCDRNVLAEFSLLGPILEVPEYLFYHRLHPEALGAAMNSDRSLNDLKLRDPGIDWNVRFPTLIRFANYFASIHRIETSILSRFLCDIQLFRIILEKAISRITSNRKLSQG